MPRYSRLIVTAPDLPAKRPDPARRGGAPRSAGKRPGTRSRIVPPILVRQIRNGIEESVHRGDIVEVDATGG